MAFSFRAGNDEMTHEALTGYYNGGVDTPPVSGMNVDIFSLADIQILCLEKRFVSRYGGKLGHYDIDEVCTPFLE